MSMGHIYVKRGLDAQVKCDFSGLGSLKTKESKNDDH